MAVTAIMMAAKRNNGLPPQLRYPTHVGLGFNGNSNSNAEQHAVARIMSSVNRGPLYMRQNNYRNQKYDPRDVRAVGGVQLFSRNDERSKWQMGKSKNEQKWMVIIKYKNRTHAQNFTKWFNSGATAAKRLRGALNPTHGLVKAILTKRSYRPVLRTPMVYRRAHNVKKHVEIAWDIRNRLI